MCATEHTNYCIEHKLKYQILRGTFVSIKKNHSVVYLLVACTQTVPVMAQYSSSVHDVVVPISQPQSTEEGQRRIELSAGGQNLTAGYGNWSDVTLKGMYKISSHLIQGEVSVNRRFDKNGTFVGISDTYTFNEDWFGSLSLGAGDGAFYLPNYRVDAVIYKKWLNDRKLVTSLGGGYYRAPDGHADKSVSIGAAYYFDSPWIVEGGLRLNSSNPGSIKTQQQFVAVTYGRDKQDLITARHGWGGEGYLSIAANAQLVNFKSRESSLSWRHWIDARTGISIGANHYINPQYRRSGVNFGIFHDF